jgi:hypothetical protein
MVSEDSVHGCRSHALGQNIMVPGVCGRRELFTSWKMGRKKKGFKDSPSGLLLLAMPTSYFSSPPTML